MDMMEGKDLPASAGERVIFARCSGQDDNIGDIVLRRRMLREFRAFGSVRVYCRRPSVGFIEGLRLSQRDRLYTNFDEWCAAMRAAPASKVVMIDNPGELSVTRHVLMTQLRLLPTLRRIVRAGGLVLRVGVGASRPPGALRRPFHFAFQYHRPFHWRDATSRDAFGFGEVMPDWGFADDGPDALVPCARSSETRDQLTVALRFDRPYPQRPWFDGVTDFCGRANLRPVVVTQVRRDREVAARLAKDLQADFVDWNADESHVEQERKLRAVYRRCRVSISDRLHVLIVSMTEGAIPICLVDREERKIERHFAAIGYPGTSVNVAGQDAGAISNLMTGVLDRAAEIQRCGEQARASIDRVSRDLHRLLGDQGRG